MPLPAVVQNALNRIIVKKDSASRSVVSFIGDAPIIRKIVEGRSSSISDVDESLLDAVKRRPMINKLLKPEDNLLFQESLYEIEKIDETEPHKAESESLSKETI